MNARNFSLGMRRFAKLTNSMPARACASDEVSIVLLQKKFGNTHVKKRSHRGRAKAEHLSIFH